MESCWMLCRRNVAKFNLALAKVFFSRSLTRFSELKSAVQNRLHINNNGSGGGGNGVESPTNELLLSQEVAVNMLDDVRQSAKRCMMVRLCNFSILNPKCGILGGGLDQLLKNPKMEHSHSLEFTALGLQYSCQFSKRTSSLPENIYMQSAF